MIEPDTEDADVPWAHLRGGDAVVLDAAMRDQRNSALVPGPTLRPLEVVLTERDCTDAAIAPVMGDLHVVAPALLTQETRLTCRHIDVAA